MIDKYNAYIQNHLSSIEFIKAVTAVFFFLSYLLTIFIAFQICYVPKYVNTASNNEQMYIFYLT